VIVGRVGRASFANAAVAGVTSRTRRRSHVVDFWVGLGIAAWRCRKRLRARRAAEKSLRRALDRAPRPREVQAFDSARWGHGRAGGAPSVWSWMEMVWAQARKSRAHGLISSRPWSRRSGCALYGAETGSRQNVELFSFFSRTLSRGLSAARLRAVRPRGWAVSEQRDGAVANLRRTDGLRSRPCVPDGCAAIRA